MKYFYGANRKHSYFEGWYFKHQAGAEVILFIVAFHITKKGTRYATLQIVSPQGIHRFRYSADDFYASKKHLHIRIGQSVFTKRGCLLNIKSKDLLLQGKIRYRDFHLPSSPIMGPFQQIPKLQCYHEIFSLSHLLSGSLIWNGKAIDFTKGIGYIEGDRGTSFPSRYLWTQCSQPNTPDFCIMAAVATIPFSGFQFTGCIASILYQGKEYRFGTYRFATVQSFQKNKLVLFQKDMCLKIKLLKSKPFTLLAPANGHMKRTIEESPVCHVHYKMIYKNQILFDFVSEQASFEYSSFEQ